LRCVRRAGPACVRACSRCRPGPEGFAIVLGAMPHYRPLSNVRFRSLQARLTRFRLLLWLAEWTRWQSFSDNTGTCERSATCCLWETELCGPAEEFCPHWAATRIAGILARCRRPAAPFVRRRLFGDCARYTGSDVEFEAVSPPACRSTDKNDRFSST